MFTVGQETSQKGQIYKEDHKERRRDVATWSKDLAGKDEQHEANRLLSKANNMKQKQKKTN